MTQVHDVLVIGAGPAGATIARLLACEGWDVALVEKACFPRRKVCGEFISGSCRFLLCAPAVAEVCRISEARR
ncbi:MAG: FAD-dependent monooxygenase [Alphaproteobacteria bacterium]|nr:FAD-dependent monooxygenase [Alphaproteobacteria bacterium]